VRFLPAADADAPSGWGDGAGPCAHLPRPLSGLARRPGRQWPARPWLALLRPSRSPDRPRRVPRNRTRAGHLRRRPGERGRPPLNPESAVARREAGARGEISRNSRFGRPAAHGWSRVLMWKRKGDKKQTIFYFRIIFSFPPDDYELAEKQTVLDTCRIVNACSCTHVITELHSY
jgi:hypothetical protein